MRCNQFFTNWNLINRPTNQLMSMSVFKITSNLTEDQTTNPEVPIRAKVKIIGIFVSPGTRTKIKIDNNKARSHHKRAKVEVKHFQRDSDAKPFYRDQSY